MAGSSASAVTTWTPPTLRASSPPAVSDQQLTGGTLSCAIRILLDLQRAGVSTDLPSVQKLVCAHGRQKNLFKAVHINLIGLPYSANYGRNLSRRGLFRQAARLAGRCR
jgi:hypothetical protein